MKTESEPTSTDLPPIEYGDDIQKTPMLTREEGRKIMREYRKKMGDITLANAVMAWNPRLDLKHDDGRIMIVHHAKGHEDALDLMMTVGACNAGWTAGGKAKTLERLFKCAWDAVAIYKLDGQDVHEALLSIPEYRAEMARRNLTVF